jgi:hypothetical protein
MSSEPGTALSAAGDHKEAPANVVVVEDGQSCPSREKWREHAALPHTCTKTFANDNPLRGYFLA